MANQQLRRAPGSSGLYDVLDLILDRGLVIDAYVRVSLVGIELVTVDARIVVASVDTYIRWAEAMERLGWHERERTPSAGLPDMVGDGMTSRALDRGADRLSNALGGGGERQRKGNGRMKSVTSGVRHAAAGAGHVIARGAESLKESLVGDEEEAERHEDEAADHYEEADDQDAKASRDEEREARQEQQEESSEEEQ